MQSTDRLDLRGMTTAHDIDEHARFADLVSGAHCAVTVDAGEMERPYQGIVEISPRFPGGQPGAIISHGPCRFPAI